MKKLLTTLLLLTAVTMGVNAAKALGNLRTVKQPDGTVLSYRVLGDEYFAWSQTADGVLIWWENNCFYIGTITGNHELKNSGIIAHNKENRSSAEVAAIAEQDKDRATFFTWPTASNSKSSGNQRKKISYDENKYIICPHEGNITVPVLLVEYSDTPFRVGTTKGSGERASEETVKAEFNKYFNDISSDFVLGQSSVAKYFSDASYGKLVFNFELHGIYNLGHPHDEYGKTGGTRNLFEDAVNMAIANATDKVDFSDTKYDSNGDGYPDMVCVLFAGAGGNVTADPTSNKTTDFWPCCYPGNYSTTFTDSNNKSIRIPVIGGFAELSDYSTKDGEVYVRGGIGVTCHELSHGLGMPDLYDTNTSVKRENYNNNGPEWWDLMDGGENINTTKCPCQYLAWEKDYFDWYKAEELTEPADITIKPMNQGGSAYKVVNPADATEYYIIEAVQTTEWNKGLFNYFKKYINNNATDVPGGLLIQHVSKTALTSLSPNNTYVNGYQPSLTIIPADGVILSQSSVDDTNITATDFLVSLAGDQYPGTSDVTSLAAYNNYTGEEMVTKYPITDITQYSDGSISFKFMGGSTSAISSAITDNTKTTDNRIYTIDGRYIGTSKKDLPSGLYIMNGKKFAM